MKVYKNSNYCVSEDGKVFNINSGRELKQTLVKNKYRSGKGYYRVCLMINKKRKDIFVHILVYETFNGEIKEGMQVDHVDGDNFNNNLNNLEQTTQSENMKRSYSNGKRKRANKEIIRSDGVLFKSLKDASIATNCSYSGISMVLNGKRDKCGGYGWRYKKG